MSPEFETLPCPRCGTDLVAVESGGAATWACASCRGRAVGVAVLRRFAPKERVDALWNDVARIATGTGGRCPSCRRPMRVATERLDGKPLTLDVCRTCQFVWFDADELAAFSPGGTEPRGGDPDLSPEARRALAVAKVEAVSAGERIEDGGLKAAAALGGLAGFLRLLTVLMR